jgi:hypothetical protein
MLAVTRRVGILTLLSLLALGAPAVSISEVSITERAPK